MKKLLTEGDVIRAWKNRKREIFIPPNGIVTPAAADAAKTRGIRIETSLTDSPQSISRPQISASTTVSNRVFLGADHGGFELKEVLERYLLELNYDVEDVGTHSTESVDYPDFAHLVASKVVESTGARGLIIDGAGVGSAITANKVPGIRAATCHDVYTARNSRAHNNANVLTLGSRVLGVDVAKGIVQVWLETSFEGGRHQARVSKMMDVERKYRS